MPASPEAVRLLDSLEELHGVAKCDREVLGGADIEGVGAAVSRAVQIAIGAARLLHVTKSTLIDTLLLQADGDGSVALAKMQLAVRDALAQVDKELAGVK